MATHKIEASLDVDGTANLTSAAGTAHMLTLHNTSNANGCSINFSDITAGNQTGTIDFFHSDSLSQGGGASFVISSTEADMVLNVGGRIVATAHSSNAEVDYGFVDDIDTGMMRSGANAIRFVTGGTAALDIDSSQNATFASAVTVTGNLTANGNIIGDDSTSITNISSIGADTYSADADGTTRIQMSATSIDCLVEDEDVFNCSSTTLTVDAKLVAKKRVLAKTSSTDANADGDIVYFGATTSMDAGKIYYYTAGGAWALADADAESTAKGMLAVALGSASDTNGMLIRGMVTLDTDPGTIGDTLFLSTTAGVATSTAPSGNGDIVRVIGYCLDSTNGQIYFNPDGTFVEVSA